MSTCRNERIPLIVKDLLSLLGILLAWYTALDLASERGLAADEGLEVWKCERGAVRFGTGPAAGVGWNVRARPANPGGCAQSRLAPFSWSARWKRYAHT